MVNKELVAVDVVFENDEAMRLDDYHLVNEW
jgi:hypothetical protein